jgi:hypothetical protein
MEIIIANNCYDIPRPATNDNQRYAGDESMGKSVYLNTWDKL